MSAVSRAPASVGVIGTTVAHLLLGATLFLAAHRSHGPDAVTYAVSLMAAPAPSTTGAKVAEAATPKAPVEKPVVAKATTKPVKATPKKPEPVKPVPKKPEPAAVDPAKPGAKVKSDVVPAVGEKPSTGQDVITRTFAGLDFPDKEYLGRIINEVYAKFSQDGWAPGLEATIGFTIHRDGSVTDVTVLKSSRDYRFTTAAKSAVVTMGDAHVLPRLPTAWPNDVLDISFTFAPRKP